jgi:hypothetical protein
MVYNLVFEMHIHNEIAIFKSLERSLSPPL